MTASAFSVRCGAVSLLFGCRLLAEPLCDSSELKEARRLVTQRQFQEAIQILEPFEKAHPACDPDQYRMLALAQVNLHRGGLALDITMHGLSVFPDSQLLQLYLISAVDYAASKEEAIQRLRQASEVASRSSVIGKALCKALLKENPESAEAVSRLKTLLAAQPGDIETRSLYAQWLYSVNRPGEALKELAAIRRQPPVDTHFEVNCDLLEAAAQDQQGNSEAARTAYRKAIALNANTLKPDVRPEWSYARFLMQNGEGREAEPVLRSLLARSPAFAPARLALAEILCARGDYTAAIEQANLGLESSSSTDDRRRAHAFLSRAYHLTGNDDSARVHAGWVEPK